MKAVLLYEYGDASQLKYEDTAVPEYGDNEVLVRVKATSINPVDYKIRSGAAKSAFRRIFRRSWAAIYPERWRRGATR